MASRDYGFSVVKKVTRTRSNGNGYSSVLASKIANMDGASICGVDLKRLLEDAERAPGGQVITFKAEPGLLEDLDSAARLLRVTRSTVIRASIMLFLRLLGKVEPPPQPKRVVLNC
jgi:hypothetical protein